VRPAALSASTVVDSPDGQGKNVMRAMILSFVVVCRRAPHAIGAPTGIVARVIPRVIPRVIYCHRWQRPPILP
jgi:hypothetical protein